MGTIDFSGVPRSSLRGRLARLPLRLIPRGARVPILQGPMKGKRWIAGSHVHGCWLGSYELDKQKLFVSRVRPGQVVMDIGANVGFYTLLSSQLVGEKGRVVAFEPLPRNIAFLREHLRINRVQNATLIEAAVSERSGEATFQEGGSGAMGRISSGGGVRVKLVSVDELVERGEAPRPDVMKIDVEGAEAMVLRGAARTIAGGARPLIFLATHGAPVHRECCDLLRSWGYRLSSMSDKSLEETDEVLAE